MVLKKKPYYALRYTHKDEHTDCKLLCALFIVTWDLDTWINYLLRKDICSFFNHTLQTGATFSVHFLHFNKLFSVQRKGRMTASQKSSTGVRWLPLVSCISWSKTVYLCGCGDWPINSYRGSLDFQALLPPGLDQNMKWAKVLLSSGIALERIVIEGLISIQPAWRWRITHAVAHTNLHICSSFDYILYKYIYALVGLMVPH